MAPELPHELLEFLGQDEGEGALAVQLAHTWDTWILEVQLVRSYTGPELRVTGQVVWVAGMVYRDGVLLDEGEHSLALGDRVLWFEDETLCQARVVRARGLGFKPRIDKGNVAVVGLAALFAVAALYTGAWQRLPALAVEAPPMERVVQVVLPAGLGEDHPDVQDPNPTAGPGASQEGPAGASGSPVATPESGQHQRRRGQQTDVSPQPIPNDVLSVVTVQGWSQRSGRTVAGLTSQTGSNRMGWGDQQGPGQGHRGQLTRGVGIGADGVTPMLSGLFTRGPALGAAGRGMGAGEGDTGSGDLDGPVPGRLDVAPFYEVGPGQVQMVLLENDTSSFVGARQALMNGNGVLSAGVFVEDFINALDYEEELPQGGFELTAQTAPHPTQPDLLLLRVGVLAAEAARPPVDVTLVVDDSCSMDGSQSLVRSTVGELVANLEPTDRVRLFPMNAPRVELTAPDDPDLVQAIDALGASGGSPIANSLETGLQLAAQDPQGGHVILVSDGESTGIEEAAQRAWSAGLGFSVIIVEPGRYSHGIHTLNRAGLLGGASTHRVDTGRAAEALGARVGQLIAPLDLPALEVRFDPQSVRSSRLLGYGARSVMAVDNGQNHGDPVRPGAVGRGGVVTALFELELQPGAERLGRVALPSLASREVYLGDGDPDLAQLAFAASAFAEHLQGSPYRSATLGQVARIFDRFGFNRSHREMRGLVMLAR